MVTIKAACKEHIDQIHNIEEESFVIPWTKEAIRRDILENKISIYLVALEGDKVVGYAGMWHVVTEGHITNLAVAREYRRQGIADKLIKRFIEIAEEKEMIGLTLEVRISNLNAQRLYTGNGFVCEGIRKEYYSDTLEDALIMWKHIKLGR